MDTLVRTEPRIRGVVVLDQRKHSIHRTGLLLASVIPLVGFGVAVVSLWGRGLTMLDVVLFLVFYAFTGLGVTVGFHRLLAHRAFDAPAPVKGVLALAGSMSVEMSAIDWVATHRRHHAYSDRPGDPHSPHLGAAQGWKGIARGLWHAHMGWLLGAERTSRERWAPDLLKDRTVRRVDALFGWCVLATFALPPLIAFIITRSWHAALGAFFWASLTRIFLLHHVTFSINSLCHFYGRRPFETKERSTNFWPLAVLSFGESWHNNHHAYPSSAFLGHRGWQPDPGRWLLRTLVALRLATNLKLPYKDAVPGQN